jgi:hypothetical protein
MSGQVVPMGRSLNSQVGGLILRNGGPGVLAGVYPRTWRDSQDVEETDAFVNSSLYEQQDSLWMGC